MLQFEMLRITLNEAPTHGYNRSRFAETVAVSTRRSL